MLKNMRLPFTCHAIWNHKSFKEKVLLIGQVEVSYTFSLEVKVTNRTGRGLIHFQFRNDLV